MSANAALSSTGPSTAPSLGGAVRSDDQIGLLSGIGNDHLRLEIPATQESLLDVVEMVR